MLLEALRVIHYPKQSSHAHFSQLRNEGASISGLLPDAFCVDTCQRTFWVFSRDHSLTIELQGMEIYSGSDAYRFLLKVATGLESEVQGETDVFGQLKEAWQNYLLQGRGFGLELAPWMQRVFEDTKDIRSSYLQNTGSATYGGLVRKLLKHYGATYAQPLLLVGAGHIARSIAPWLTEHELWLSNRSSENLGKFAEELSLKPGMRVRIVQGFDEEARAWRDAAHVILCIPAQSKEDEKRMKLFEAGLGRQGRRSIIHLGALRKDAGPWNQYPNFHPLDDLFALQKQQTESRRTQFERALKACDEKSILRSLASSAGSSISLAHGWEDLAVFA